MLSSSSICHIHLGKQRFYVSNQNLLFAHSISQPFGLGLRNHKGIGEITQPVPSLKAASYSS